MSEPVVYLHPIGLDGRVWRGIAGPDDRCLDFPGFGREPAVGDLSMELLAYYVVSRLDGPATLVGLSLGGMVAQQVAVRYPDAVRSLVVACTTPVTNAAVLRQRAVDTRAGGMAGVLDVTLERWFTPASLGEPGHPGVAYATECLLGDDEGVVAAYWEAMAGHDVVDQLGQIVVPTTAIAGTQDQASPVDGLRRISEQVRYGVLELLEGPHMLPLEHPKAFAAVIERHLDRLVEGPAGG